MANVVLYSRTGAVPFGTLVSQNIIVNGRRTSMRLEPTMWDSLYEIAKRENMSINDLVSEIKNQVTELYGDCKSLTAAVRTFIALYYRHAATEEGHQSAGHGIGRPLKGTVLERQQAKKKGQIRVSSRQ